MITTFNFFNRDSQHAYFAICCCNATSDLRIETYLHVAARSCSAVATLPAAASKKHLQTILRAVQNSTLRELDLIITATNPGTVENEVVSDQLIKHVRFEVSTAVTMKNAVFWDIKTQFVLHRRHITYPLQNPAN
jgi:hypothetical protein